MRVTLKKAYADGTVAVDMDPLSLRCRLATSVPPPRFHAVRYAGVLGPASEWRPRIVPQPPAQVPVAAGLPGVPESQPSPERRPNAYRPRAELLARTFAVDVLTCPSGHGRMKLLAMVKDPAPCYLEAIGELTELPPRSPNRGPPYWKSRVLRRLALGDEDAREGHGSGADQTA